MDPTVMAYAAWQWLYHCFALRKLSVSSTWESGAKRYALSLHSPPGLPSFPGVVYFHLQVRLSAEGTCLEAVPQSAATRPDGLRSSAFMN